ncbi:MAG: bifunctional adenosylcobinamide kinase/adenosylcobinamide-phosphate guanylyltransferase [Defluviitaleaceae bacterium]|nr:bifunctional adenosylcobinamide kinase/adenosylcobinamide-phosphate guanylyltransferase [Defluviitaleaceae bacterium]MCL2836232.1 bifunctional adenosylcobinamide kinase/adenosylcobinamide-phosphate guanylyltransferase [Defluviitaleaceae bacterium]
MILVFGGAYQGKTEYACERYAGMEIITEFHLKVLEMVKNGIDAVENIKISLPEYADKVIICDDISCGVVPVDAAARKWREELGRVLAILSKESDEVVRMFCGIPTRLK